MVDGTDDLARSQHRHGFHLEPRLDARMIFIYFFLKNLDCPVIYSIFVVRMRG